MNDQLTAIFVVKNTNPSRLAAKFVEQYNLAPDSLYQCHLIASQYNKITQCIFVLFSTDEAAPLYKKELYFDEFAVEDFRSYVSLPLKIFDNREVSILDFNKITMSEDEFLAATMEFLK